MTESWGAELLIQCLISVGFLVITWKIGIFDKAEYGFKRLGAGIKQAWVLGIVWILLIGMAVYNAGENLVMPEIRAIVPVILSGLGIGLFEEVLMRGLIFKKLCVLFQNKENGVTIALLISSGIFGIIHIVNLLADPTLLVATPVQILYAFWGGMYFAMLYKRTKSMWLVILLHGITDIISGMSTLISSTLPGMYEITLQKGIVELLIFSPLLFASIYLLKKDRVKEPAL